MKKILVIQTAFIGDVILATSVLEALHHALPDAELHFLVRKGNEALLHHHPFLKKLWIWNKKEEKYRGMLRLIRSFRNERFDHVVNLQRFAASGIMTAFSGAKERIGFNKNPFSFLFDKSFPHVIGSKQSPGLHETERCLQLVEHLTGKVKQGPCLYPSQEDQKTVSAYTSHSFVTMSPASVWFTKQWPEERWVDLLNRTSGKVYLLGGPGDKALCERIRTASTNSNAEVLAGQFSLLQSAALMQKARMNYCNDSAPLHLCSAMQAPVTALFCSTIPEFGFGPINTSYVIAQTDAHLDCRPCGLHGHKACPKGHFDCSRINVV